jgi:hypothetical protein
MSDYTMSWFHEHGEPPVVGDLFRVVSAERGTDFYWGACTVVEVERCAKERPGAMDELRSLADRECTCTPEQESGGDPSVCLRCSAANELNDIGERARDTLRLLKQRSEK